MDNDACGIDNAGQVRCHRFTDTFFYFIEDFGIGELRFRDVLLVIQNNDSEVFNNGAGRTDQHRFWNLVKERVGLYNLKDMVYPGKHS